MSMSDLDRWETRFDTADYVFGTAPNDFLRSQRHLLVPGQRALAVADGEGRNGVWLAEQGLEVLSVDFSEKALAKAKRLAEARGVRLRTERVDLSEWPWPEAAFDLVAAIFIQFAGPALRARIFAGIKQALKPGGLLLMQGYRPEQLVYKTGGPPHLENLYTRELLEEAFEDFELLKLDAHDSVIQEGTGHGGMSALVDLVARRP
jgi:cyclopropane fatty-acyl-phospholipid synthase-like methyltransferase